MDSVLVAVPGNPGDDVPIGTLRAVLTAAYVPDLPGCMSTGRTLDETKVNIREAIEGHLATLRALGDPVPEPCILAGEVEVSPAA